MDPFHPSHLSSQVTFSEEPSLATQQMESQSLSITLLRTSITTARPQFRADKIVHEIQKDCIVNASLPGLDGSFDHWTQLDPEPGPNFGLFVLLFSYLQWPIFDLSQASLSSLGKNWQLSFHHPLPGQGSIWLLESDYLASGTCLLHLWWTFTDLLRGPSHIWIQSSSGQIH